MINVKRTFCLLICILIFGSQVFAFDTIYYEEFSIKNNIEKTYGINIIIPEDADYCDFIECMRTLENSLNKLPDNMIKEITDYYLNKGLATNVLIDKKENIKDLFSVSTDDDSSVNIYINTLESSFYSVSEEAILHELGHFISNYMFEVYDINKMKNEFDKLNAGYEYGSWGDEYYEAFVNKHSATSFKDEIADLIWYAEANPSILRNIKGNDIAVIHKKLIILAEAFDQTFSSISENTKLWLDAIPQEPEDWAKSTISEMKKASLLPEEFSGLYQAYISKEDFYKLLINMLQVKIGEDKLYDYFSALDYEDYVALDPLKGEVFLADGMNYKSYKKLSCNDDEILQQAYNMGIINSDVFKNSEEYMTRLEIARSLVYIGNELGMDFSDYEKINYNDIDQVADNEKHYIYISGSKGFLKGDGLNFKPFDNCTYQEAYIMLMRFYNLI